MKFFSSMPHFTQNLTGGVPLFNGILFCGHIIEGWGCLDVAPFKINSADGVRCTPIQSPFSCQLAH